MYELEFTPNQAKSYQVGFDLTTESVGGYVANTDYLSIDTWDNNSYVSNVVLDGGVQLSGDIISGTVTITTTNNISNDFVLNITMRYNDADNSINKTISQTMQMTNNLGGLDQVTWQFNVTGDIVATRDYGTGTETLSNVTITLFPKNQNDELPGIAVGKLDEIFDLAATTVYLDSKDQQTFQSVDIVSYNYKDSNDSFIFVLSPTIKLSNEGRNADHIELVFHTTYGSTTYNAKIPWSITINESKIPDMYYIPSENKMSTEYIDIDTEGNDLLDAANGQAYLLNRDSGVSTTKTGPFITYNCTMDLYLSAMKEDVSYVVQPYFSGYDISGVIIKGKYIRYFITESKTSTVISGDASDDIYLQNGYKNGELTNSTVGSTGSIGWNEESFDYYIMNSEFDKNMLEQGYHKTFHFESGKTYYIYPVIGFRGIGNPMSSGDHLGKIDCDIRVALLGQKTPPEEMESSGGGVQVTDYKWYNHTDLSTSITTLDLPFSLVLEHAANIRVVITFSGIPSFDVDSDLIITQISNVGTGSDNDLSSIGISNIDMYNKELSGSNLILDIYLDTIKHNTVSEYKTLEYRVQIEKLAIDTRITLQIRRSDPATLQILDIILTPNNTTYGNSGGEIHVATAVSTYISNYTLDGSKLYIAGYKVSAERNYIETVMLESENANVSGDQISAYTTIKWRNHVTPPGDYNIAITYGYKDEINSIDEKKEVLYYMNYGGGEYIKLSNLTIDSPIYYTPNSNVDIRYYPNFSIDVDTNLDTLNLEKLKMVHVQHETITGEYNLGEGGSNLAFEYINEDSLEYNSQSKKITGTFNLVIWTIPANHCFENTYGIIYEDTDSGITSNEVSASWLLKDPALDSNYIIIPTEKK